MLPIRWGHTGLRRWEKMRARVTSPGLPTRGHFLVWKQGQKQRMTASP